ncbi:MAG: AAA family ATPase [Thermoplasmata archaeon]|nr:AAA family ATPase [Thermoplasmata archaeon]
MSTITNKGLRIAISGKGGVGKTTLTVLLAKLFADDGSKVIVIDADSSPNLSAALGLPRERADAIIPLSRMSDLIEERTGVRPGESYGQMFKLNPQVDDLVEKFGVETDDKIKLLVLGTINAAGSGCFCPENALIKRLMRHMVLKRDEVLIMDMEAGVEHLGRGTTKNIDVLLTVVEPGLRSVTIATKIKSLAEELELKKIYAVLNKVTDDSEIKVVEAELAAQGIPLLGSIPYDKALINADLKGLTILNVEGNENILKAAVAIKQQLEENL